MTKAARPSGSGDTRSMVAVPCPRQGPALGVRPRPSGKERTTGVRREASDWWRSVPKIASLRTGKFEGARHQRRRSASPLVEVQFQRVLDVGPRVGYT